MTSILFLKIRVVIPSQQVNACLPIFMTDCGMVDIETLLQSQKAHSPISVKLSGKEAKSKFLSILNALLPIYVTDGGIFTCSNFSQVLKALFSIIFNCAGNITFFYMIVLFKSHLTYNLNFL